MPGVMSRETYEDSKKNKYEVDVETLEAEPFNPSDALRAAIEAGNVKTRTETVEYFVTDKEKRVTKIFRKTFTACDAQNESGALALPAVQGDESKLWAFVSERSNYQGSAGTGEERGEKSVRGKQDIYIELRNLGQGPEKAIEQVRKKIFSIPGLSEDMKRAAFNAALLEMGLTDFVEA